MDDASTHVLPQANPGLWLLSLLVATVVGHLLMGYVRHARRGERRPGRHAARWLAPGLAAAAFGAGVVGAMALVIGSQALAYPIGYLRLGIGASGAAAVAGAALAALLLVRWLHPATIAVAALLLGLAVAGSGALLVRSLGLLPGLAWSPSLLATAAALGAAGAGGGLWLGLLGPGREGRHRRAWRALAAAVVGIAIAMAQQLVLGAGDMSTQIASAYREDVRGTWMAVAAAAAVPALLSLLVFDLHLREVRARLDAGRGERSRSRRHAGALR